MPWNWTVRLYLALYTYIVCCQGPSLIIISSIRSSTCTLNKGQVRIKLVQAQSGQISPLPIQHPEKSTCT
jgi:hypothetical protein